MPKHREDGRKATIGEPGDLPSRRSPVAGFSHLGTERSRILRNDSHGRSRTGQPVGRASSLLPRRLDRGRGEGSHK
ncbi:hypothetical protein SPHINGOAX6_30281 [Sphingomonas sp. AX6]|nr:hypothetical protein SPHINGOAX6_30281 [Sphingomonas sp. AX6]